MKQKTINGDLYLGFGPFLHQDHTTWRRAHYPGDKAKWNSLRSGLIACVVKDVVLEDAEQCGMAAVTIELTESAGPWKKGEIFQAHGLNVFPLKSIKKRQYTHHLISDYCWRPGERP